MRKRLLYLCTVDVDTDAAYEEAVEMLDSFQTVLPGNTTAGWVRLDARGNVDGQVDACLAQIREVGLK